MIWVELASGWGNYFKGFQITSGWGAILQNTMSYLGICSSSLKIWRRAQVWPIFLSEIKQNSHLFIFGQISHERYLFLYSTLPFQHLLHAWSWKMLRCLALVAAKLLTVNNLAKIKSITEHYWSEYSHSITMQNTVHLGISWSVSVMICGQLTNLLSPYAIKYSPHLSIWTWWVIFPEQAPSGCAISFPLHHG